MCTYIYTSSHLSHSYSPLSGKCAVANNYIYDTRETREDLDKPGNKTTTNKQTTKHRVSHIRVSLQVFRLLTTKGNTWYLRVMPVARQLLSPRRQPPRVRPTAERALDHCHCYLDFLSIDSPCWTIHLQLHMGMKALKTCRKHPVIFLACHL